MPPLDLGMPDGSRYMGFKVPEACTVARWRAFVELGGAGAKVLYAGKLHCYRDPERRIAMEDVDALPERPNAVFIGGPGSVVMMLELALKRRLGPAVPPGRFLMCASPQCNLLVCSSPMAGGYCCIQCCRGSSHGSQCEQRMAPAGTPKAEPSWIPDDPHGKYQNASLTHNDLRKDDEDWAQPRNQEKADQRALIQKMNIFIGPYLDYSERSASDCIKLYKSSEHGWSLDYDPNFICELLYEGFYTRGLEFAVRQPPIQLLVVSWDKKMSVWDFHETHVSRQVRKRAKHCTMTIDTAFDDVLLGCVRMHGENWLFRGWRWMVRKLFREGYTGKEDIRVSVHSFELWDKDSKLVAGDIGAFIGGVYTSMTGFHERHTRSLGEVQMVLTTALLRQLGFEWVDLGQVLPYKESLGARVVGRQEYLERLHRDRDKRPPGTVDGGERFQGSHLLAQLFQVAGGRTDAAGRKARERRPAPKAAPAPVAPRPAKEGDEGDHGLADEEALWSEAAALVKRKAGAAKAPLQGPRSGAAATEARLWTVVGGREKGGIVVRCQESTSSAALPSRLSTGSQVERLTVVGNRLHYRKVTGGGPESGWVSIRYEDRMLVQPLLGDGQQGQ